MIALRVNIRVLQRMNMCVLTHSPIVGIGEEQNRGRIRFNICMTTTLEKGLAAGGTGVVVAIVDVVAHVILRSLLS
jgi:hypothetical protein